MPRTSDKELRYNAKDAACTLAISTHLMKEIASQGYQSTYDHTIDLYGPLQYMMIRGVRVDQDELAKMKVKIDDAITQYQIELNTLCKRPLNANSSKDCQKYFYTEKGIPPYTKYNKKTQKSAVTLDDKALQRLARGTSVRAGFKEAKIIQRIRQLRKLKGTYLDIVFDNDSRLRCSYKPRGTRFGRLSSGKTIFETGMNMQNLPLAFQRFLVADEDKLLISFDKAQAEWVVVAYASGDEAMINAVESNVDAHAYTASGMFKIPIDIIKMEHKIVETDNDPEVIYKKRREINELRPYLDLWMPRNMSMRQCGKKSNHGLNYDERAKMFALINEITDKEADVIVEFYHRLYPGIRRWYDATKTRLAVDRTLVNPFGRKYTFLGKWDHDLWKSAYSFIPQSTVGEMVNRSMCSIYHDNSPELSELELLMQVHDSLDFQDQYQDIPKLVQSCRTIYRHMTYPLELNGRQFTIGTDLKIGFSMGNLKAINLRQSDEALANDIKAYIDEHQRTIATTTV